MWVRFNSQRDGILFKQERFIDMDYAEFQFPTGWNSIVSLRWAVKWILVSIPNGMEFYIIAPPHLATKEPFQFPTGWNSISGVDVFNVSDGGFNSQRDGILLSSWDWILPSDEVSIPNGMEFYRNQLPPYSVCGYVSIPNGMEFYLSKSALSIWTTPSFNSQRDGILLYRYVERLSEYLFQFPTGWNSIL